MEKFLIQFAREYNKSLDIDLNEIKDKLESYAFPGNVRELKNFCILISQIYNRIDNEVIIDEFDKHVNRTKSLYINNSISYFDNYYEALISKNNFFEAVQDFEKNYIEYHLKKNYKRVSATAKAIGLDRTTLYKKIKKYDIDVS